MGRSEEWWWKALKRMYDDHARVCIAMLKIYQGSRFDRRRNSMIYLSIFGGERKYRSHRFHHQVPLCFTKAWHHQAAKIWTKSGYTLWWSYGYRFWLVGWRYLGKKEENHNPSKETPKMRWQSFSARKSCLSEILWRIVIMKTSVKSWNSTISLQESDS